MAHFRTPYDDDRYNNAPYQTHIRQDKAAQQHFKDECDVNLIVPRYMRDGTPPLFAKNYEGIFDELGEAIDIADYQHNLDVIIEAESEFMSLPSHVRKHYDNDPLKLLQAVQSGDKYLYELGLATKPVDPAKPADPAPGEA